MKISIYLSVSGSFSQAVSFSFFQILQRFAIVDLSNFYFDVAKDRLYVGYGVFLSIQSSGFIIFILLLLGQKN